MACSPEILRGVPLFALLDDEETAVLAGQVELRNFTVRQRIWKIGDPGGRREARVSLVSRRSQPDLFPVSHGRSHGVSLARFWRTIVVQTL